MFCLIHCTAQELLVQSRLRENSSLCSYCVDLFILCGWQNRVGGLFACHCRLPTTDLSEKEARALTAPGFTVSNYFRLGSQDWIAFFLFLGRFNQMLKLKQCLWPKVHVSPLPPWCVDSCHQVNPGITRSMYFLWPTIHILPLGVRRSRQRMDLCHLLRRK